MVARLLKLLVESLVIKCKVQSRGYAGLGKIPRLRVAHSLTPDKAREERILKKLSSIGPLLVFKMEKVRDC